MQCCWRSSRQHCIRKKPVQFYLNTLGTTLHRSNLMQLYPRGSKQQCARKKILCKIVLILLGQHCTAESPMQCCQRGSRELCVRKNPVQCCLNNLGTILHRSKPYAILSDRLQITLHKKILCNFALILLGQYCTGENSMPCCPRGFRQHCISTILCSFVSLLLGQLSTGQNLIQ